MPRKRNQDSPATDDSVAVIPATAERVKRLAKAAESEQEAKEKQLAADRFRRWVTDRASGYERLTDEEAKLVVLRFENKPDQEILDRLKDAGFRYQPDYHGLKKVWTRRNDFESRELVKAIEASVRAASPDLL